MYETSKILLKEMKKNWNKWVDITMFKGQCCQDTNSPQIKL